MMALAFIVGMVLGAILVFIFMYGWNKIERNAYMDMHEIERARLHHLYRKRLEEFKNKEETNETRTD